MLFRFEHTDIQVTVYARVKRYSHVFSVELRLTESLVRAFEAGYFKVPKEVTLTELADTEGVSHQAMSERIRRGVHHLIEQTFITGDSTDHDEE